MPVAALKKRKDLRILMDIDCLPETADYASVTKRESNILHLIALGYKNTDIAEKLNLSVRTVETYRFNLMKKLKLKNASQLVICAVDYSQLHKTI
jgi:two-component system response regulator NreC